MLGFLTWFYHLGLNDSCSVCTCWHCCRPGLLCVLAGEPVQKSLPEASVRVLELSWGYDFSWFCVHLHTAGSFSQGQATHSHWEHLEITETSWIYIYKSFTKPELEVEVVSELLAALEMGCNLKYFCSVFYPMEKSHGLVPLWNTQWIH